MSSSDRTDNASAPPIDELPSHLGYRRNDLLDAARRRAVTAVRRARNGREAVAAVAIYQNLAMAHVESLPDEVDDHARAQLGLIVEIALVWRDGGDRERYYDNLYAAYEMADNSTVIMDMSDVLPLLERELRALSDAGGTDPSAS